MASTAPADKQKEKLRAVHAGRRILLAEDEPLSRANTGDLLERAGLVVDLAADGIQAVALARRQRYALILMDMRMPNLNGIDTTRQIRADSLNSATPILAMIANALAEDRRECLAAGMNDHITKPLDLGRLYETVRRWLIAARD